MDNGIATHANSHEHCIAWYTAVVMHRQENWLKGLRIATTKPSMKLDVGLRLNFFLNSTTQFLSLIQMTSLGSALARTIRYQ